MPPATRYLQRVPNLKNIYQILAVASGNAVSATRSELKKYFSDSRGCLRQRVICGAFRFLKIIFNSGGCLRQRVICNAFRIFKKIFFRFWRLPPATRFPQRVPNFKNIFQILAVASGNAVEKYFSDSGGCLRQRGRKIFFRFSRLPPATRFPQRVPNFKNIFQILAVASGNAVEKYFSDSGGCLRQRVFCSAFRIFKKKYFKVWRLPPATSLSQLVFFLKFSVTDSNLKMRLKCPFS